MPATVVLVHGSWLGAWCWEAVVDGLATEGVTATAVDLEMRTLAGDAEITRRALADARADAQPVVLVGHSYAGMVISDAGHEADELVYVCAVLPAAGASLLESVVSPELSVPADAIVTHADGTSTLNPHRAVDVYFHRCPARVTAAAIARLRPLAGACYGATIADPAWLHVEASYVVCTDDRAVPPSLQREFAAGVRHVFEVDADHSPFYSATGPLVAALAERAHAHG
jgi:pimeloyl-ACP methyl ester carboxylesterase